MRSRASAARTHGSSPLARGLLEENLAIVDAARIIPARAGFTVDFLCMTHFT